MIVFDRKKTINRINYSSKPIFYLIRLKFVSEDPGWASSLMSATINIKISVLGDGGKALSSSDETLAIAANISPQHREAVFEVNRFFKFSFVPQSKEARQSSEWVVDIELKNLVFNPAERLELEYMDSSHIMRRVDDWEARVVSLIREVTRWTSKDKSIVVKLSRSERMHERQMKDFDIEMRELPTADILKNGKVIGSIKPFGLWIIGANGRIDLLTPNGSIILVDRSEQFQKPNWKLFSQKDRSKGVDFSKDVLFQILGL